MSEILGRPDHGPSEDLVRLYGTWARGGAGLLVTGNVMVDRRALGEPGNVVVEDDRDLPLLRRWAAAGSAEGTAIWMQLNHPGKQIPFYLSKEPVAPSAIPLGKGLEKTFRSPRALREEEILRIVARFARAAAVAQEAGFGGVQIHGAHGYLVSQFLSPRHNQRQDAWGGSPENRRRFALEILRAIRREVGGSFPVSIKLNSADFVRGGLSEEESIATIRDLEAEGIDLVEISGGSYESPAMMGAPSAARREREAFFLEFAEAARANLKVPLMLTGGFRSARIMHRVVEEGVVDVVGLARPLAIDPEFPRKVLEDLEVVSPVRYLSTGWKILDAIAFINITWYERQLARMGKGLPADPGMGEKRSILATLLDTGWQNFRRRRA